MKVSCNGNEQYCNATLDPQKLNKRPGGMFKEYFNTYFLLLFSKLGFGRRDNHECIETLTIHRKRKTKNIFLIFLSQNKYVENIKYCLLLLLFRFFNFILFSEQRQTKVDIKFNYIMQKQPCGCKSAA